MVSTKRQKEDKSKLLNKLVGIIVKNISHTVTHFNHIQEGLFQGCSRMGGGQKGSPLPKICHTYPTVMKLGSYTLPKEDPKNI